jgi:competence protein ComEC
MAGWGVPAQRTVGMLALAVALRSVGRAWPAPLVCLCAAAAVVLVDPWAVLQPGFWLSFGAVGLLLIAEPSAEPGTQADRVAAPAVHPTPTSGWSARLGRAVRSDLRTQLVVSLGLGPLSLVLFGQLSLVGLVANLFAVPWVTFVITPLAMLGVVWAPLWALGVWALEPLHSALASLADLPGGVLGVPQPSLGAAALALAGGVISALRLPLSWRLMACLWWLPLLWPTLPRPVWGQFELVAADVGQGSAILVRTASHLLVHDAGPQFSRDSDAGQRILLPMLRALGESRTDELLLSHRDADHVGGAPALLKKGRVDRMRASLEPGHPLLGLNLPTTVCAAGQRWEWDGVQFDILHPAPGAAMAGVKPNTVSCVLRVQGANGRSALLTGDLEAEQERHLVATLGPALKSTVLLVPHHGSHTSSTTEFLAAVQPAVAVIQVGYRSRFGHPHADVLARYAAAGIPVVRSDFCGAWRWSEGLSICARDELRRYWHWRQSAVAPSVGADVARVATAGERE